MFAPIVLLFFSPRLLDKLLILALMSQLLLRTFCRQASWSAIGR